MDSLKDKRACTSYRIMVSVDQVKRYKKVIAQNDVDACEYCEAKIALERVIPEWLRIKAWSIAKGHEWHEALDDVRRNLNTLG